MQSLTLAQLKERYQQLQAQSQTHQISQEQFVDAVHQLQALDDDNQWWSIDPNGNFLKYSGTEWVVALPPKSQGQTSFKDQTQPAQFAEDLPGPLRGRSCCLTSPVMVGVMSFGTAGFWLIYSNIRAFQYSNWDFVTPLFMALLPLGMRIFQRKIDNLAQPLYGITSKFPYATRAGAALAIPIILGSLTSTMQSGYGPMRFTMLVSIISGYILTRRVR